MFRTLINSLNIWETFILNFIILFLFSLLGSYIAHHFFRETVREHSKSMNNILNIMGAGYGVFLGFSIIALWNYYLHVSNIIYHEADALSVIARNLTVFPEKDRAAFDEVLRQYVLSVRNDEWKSMTNGHESQLAWDNFNTLLNRFQQFSPSSSLKEQFFYNQEISHLDEALKYRRNRLLAINSIMRDELRFALVLGGVVILFLAGLLRANGSGMHVLANSCLALIISFNLTLALHFDYPFSGGVSVSNTAFYQGILAKYK